jgi:hypothetical protein
VPLHILKRYQEDIEFFLETARIAARRANLSPDEAMELAIQEIAAYHADKRGAHEASHVTSGG